MSTAKRGGSFSFLIVMVVAMVVYSIPALRDGIGAAMNGIMNPLVSGITGLYPEYPGIAWMVIILVLASVTGLYSSLLQKYTIDYEKMRAVQERMKEFQKIYREVQLSGDEKKLKKLNEKRDKMMQDQLQMSQEQFKPMSYIMVITVPIFLWLLYVVNVNRGILEGVYYDLGSIAFPYWGEIQFADPTPFFLPAWILWYMICSLTLSQVIRKTLNIGGI
jgi:uncharacterized membrane protein (DUF106 family)